MRFAGSAAQLMAGERAVAPARLVELARDELLAGAALSRDDDAQRGRRHLRDAIDDRVDLITAIAASGTRCRA